MRWSGPPRRAAGWSGSDVYKRQVLAYDPFAKKEGLPEYIQLVEDRDEIFKQSDYVSLHVPAKMCIRDRVMTCPAPASQEEYDRFAAYLGGTVMEDCKIPLTETEE